MNIDLNVLLFDVPFALVLAGIGAFLIRAMARLEWRKSLGLVAAGFGWWIVTLAAASPFWIPCLAGGCAGRTMSRGELVFHIGYTIVSAALLAWMAKRWLGEKGLHDRSPGSESCLETHLGHKI